MKATVPAARLAAHKLGCLFGVLLLVAGCGGGSSFNQEQRFPQFPPS